MAAQWNEALGVVPLHNTMQPSDHGFPQTVAEWEGLFRSTHQKDNNKALHMAQAFITQVQNMLAVQCTEPQHQALKEWTYPDWFTPALHKGKAHAVPKKSERPLATLSGHSVDGPTDLAATSAVKPQLPLFPELPPPHADGWQPRHPEDVWLNMPKLRDTPEMWAMWIDQHPDKCLTAAYQCVAYEGCSSSNGAVFVPCCSTLCVAQRLLACPPVAPSDHSARSIMGPLHLPDCEFDNRQPCAILCRARGVRRAGRQRV